ncbi:hypothetical protein FUT87_10305, partial [Mitsuaria sp. TWR114]
MAVLVALCRQPGEVVSAEALLQDCWPEATTLGDNPVHKVVAGLRRALGDIGKLFPDTAAEFKGADSMVLLAEAYRRVKALGWVIGNVDTTIVAQQPKMAPHIPAMRERLAQVL